MSNNLQLPVAAGLAPPPAKIATQPTGSATGNPRNKVALKPGFSLMDWIKLTKSGKDLTGTGGKLLQVTPKELAKHNLRRDGWMAINGIVYNVTPYMDYHPGGFDELMKGVGKDATKIFNDVHPWVNYESMMSACIVGKLVKSSEILPPPPPPPLNNLAKKPVIPPIVGPSGPEKPKLDWHQTETSLTLSIYTRRKHMMRFEHITIDYQRSDNTLYVLVRLPDDNSAYLLAYQLEKKLASKPYSLKVLYNSGKIEIGLTKEAKERWNSLGKALEENQNWIPQNKLETKYWKWNLVSKTPVTHDVHHYVFEAERSQDLHFHVNCGHHVQFKVEIEGEKITRSYTPTFENLDLEKYQKNADPKLHFLIKTYDNGTLTPKLSSLSIGSQVEMSHQFGTFQVEKLTNIQSIFLLAAGTGITPMCKLIQFLFTLKDVKRKILLLDFNKTEQDIIWRDQFQTAQNEFCQLEIVHILSQDEKWSGKKGRIGSDLLKETLNPDDLKLKKLACICGPIRFTQEAHRLLKDEFDFSQSEIWKFEG